MKTEYVEVLVVKPDQDFEQLAHKGKAVKYILVPRDRAEEFFLSKGWVCLLPLIDADRNRVLLYDIDIR